MLIPARTKILSSSRHGGCGEGTARLPTRMSVCFSHFVRIHRLSASVGAHVLCGFCRALYARLSSEACDIIATGSRASVEHDLIAGESIQNVVNDFSIVQMFPPVGEHVFHNLDAIEFGHQITSMVESNSRPPFK
jgi:hypothetical protein